MVLCPTFFDSLRAVPNDLCIKKFSFFLILLAFPKTAFAHPGHVPTDWRHSLVHALTSPDHLVVLFGLVVLAAVILWVRS